MEVNAWASALLGWGLLSSPGELARIATHRCPLVLPPPLPPRCSGRDAGHGLRNGTPRAKGLLVDICGRVTLLQRDAFLFLLGVGVEGAAASSDGFGVARASVFG